MNTKCQHDRLAPMELIKGLPVTQAGIARHRCAICAYEAGLLAGFKLALEQIDVSDEQIKELQERKLNQISKQKIREHFDLRVEAEGVAQSIKERMEKR